jgi:tRNA(Ile)-lysidine synthase
VVIPTFGLYHVSVQELAQRVLEYIRREELLKAGDRVGVAVSGGVDSVALLRVLLELKKELGIVLSVVHFNHKLRGAESDGDEQFVANLARRYKLSFYASSGDVAKHAGEQGTGIETAARELRYRFFGELLAGNAREEQQATCNSQTDVSSSLTRRPRREGRGLRENRRAGRPSLHRSVALDKVATGHTPDDQAETVLMRVIRGTGTRGLAGIHPRLEIEDQPGEIIRPLLSVRRRELEQYLKGLGQDWREDSSNAELKYTRNRVRQTLLPMLEREFNPSVAENLSELAEIARAEEDYWESEASGWMGTAVQWFASEDQAKRASDLVQIAPRNAGSEQTGKTRSLRDLGGGGRESETGPMNASVNLAWLLAEPLALQRRVIRSIAETAGFPLEFKHVEELLRFVAAEGSSGKELALPLGWKVVREEDSLLFLAPKPAPEKGEAADFEYVLPVPGQVGVPEAGVVVQALQVMPGELAAGYNPEHLFDPELLSNELTVRNWRPGDRFWPAHTKSPKKIKELLQERHVTGRGRKLWPVVASGGEIVWVRGFAGAGKFRARDGRAAVLIREVAGEG